MGPPNSGNENTLAAVGRTPPTTATLHWAATAGPASRATAARRRSRRHIIAGRRKQQQRRRWPHGARAARARVSALRFSHAAGRERPLRPSWPPETATTRSPHFSPHMRETKTRHGGCPADQARNTAAHWDGRGPPFSFRRPRTQDDEDGGDEAKARGPPVHTVEIGTTTAANTPRFCALAPGHQKETSKRSPVIRHPRLCVPALLGLPKGRRRRRRRWASPDVNAPTPRPIDAPHFRVVTLARARHFRRRLLLPAQP